MIGIIGAMEEEVVILRDLITNPKKLKFSQIEFSQGMLFGKEVVLVKSGIGKVNAAMTTTILLEKFEITEVINTGSAGGIKEDAEVGDVVVSESVTYHDVDVTGFGYKRGQVPGLPDVFQSDKGLLEKVEQALEKTGTRHFKGQVITGDAFVHRPEQMDQIKANFPEAVALEMEAAAIAQVCHLQDVPFVVVRALSDIAGKKSEVSFEAFLPKAAEASSKMIVELMKGLSEWCRC